MLDFMNRETNSDFIFEQIVNIIHGEVTRISLTGEVIQSYGINKDQKSILCLDSNMCNNISLKNEKIYPEIIIELDTLVYAVIYCEKERILIGPVSVRKNLSKTEELFWNLHGIQGKNVYSIEYCELKVFGSAVLLAYNILTGRCIVLEELWSKNGVLKKELNDVSREMSSIIFERQEYDSPHNPYDQEVREMNSITQGNVEMLKASIAESYKGREGRMAVDELRQQKNIAIVVITLASRAAIKGGMLPEKAFSMVDAYVLAVEKLRDPIRIRSIMRNAEYNFAEQVAQSNRMFEQNEIIEHTKNYIFQHLHDDIVIGDLGKQIGVNTSYLSTLFHKVEGITIQVFIRNEKIKLAENMLRYSEYDIRDIANYLSFCSQSHFGKAFKEQTGLTPAKYRKMYQVKENMEEPK